MGGYSNPPNPDKRLKIPDSTTITVPLSTMDWARYTSEKGEVKAHTLLNYQEHIPDFTCMTTGKAKFKRHTSNLVIFLRMHLFCHVDLWSWPDCPFLTPRQIRDRGGGNIPLTQGVLNF